MHARDACLTCPGGGTEARFAGFGRTGLPVSCLLTFDFPPELWY